MQWILSQSLSLLYIPLCFAKAVNLTFKCQYSLVKWKENYRYIVLPFLLLAVFHKIFLCFHLLTSFFCTGLNTNNMVIWRWYNQTFTWNKDCLANKLQLWTDASGLTECSVSTIIFISALHHIIQMQSL